MVTIEEIFEKCIPEPNFGCWLWMGKTHGGYPYIGYKDGVVYRGGPGLLRILGAPVPPGKMGLHKCDVKVCLNPRHIYIGTANDNARDRVTNGRHRPPSPLIRRSQ